MTNSEFKIQLEKRTVAFSVTVIKMLRKIPGGLESKNIREQVMRSATAVGANYREANRAESSADFVYQIGVVAKEASESEYWITLLHELYPQVEEVHLLPRGQRRVGNVRRVARALRARHGCAG